MFDKTFNWFLGCECQGQRSKVICVVLNAVSMTGNSVSTVPGMTVGVCKVSVQTGGWIFVYFGRKEQEHPISDIRLRIVTSLPVG